MLMAKISLSLIALSFCAAADEAAVIYSGALPFAGLGRMARLIYCRLACSLTQVTPIGAIG